MKIDFAQSRTCAAPRSTLAESFKVPLNRAAAMKFLQMLVGHGYVYWNSGSVLAEKASGFLEKMASLYPILATPNQRTLSKRKQQANVYLVMFWDETRPNSLVWYLLATAGKRQLGADRHPSETGAFRDLIHQRESMKCIYDHPIRWGEHYQLRRITRLPPPEINRVKKRGPKQVWSWEMVPVTYSGWKARLEDAARHSYADVRREFKALMLSPIFPGVSDQVREIDRAAAAIWKRTHKSPYVSPLPNPLPWIGNITMFRDLTLFVLVEAMRQGTTEANAAAEAQARDVLNGIEPPLHLTTVLTME